jgi:hypothetical protein
MDIIAEFGTRNQNQIKWYHNREPHDYMRPAWVFDTGYDKSLFVWCDEHLRWNEHGVAKGEENPGCITSRCPHHRDCIGDVFYCMGVRRSRPGKDLEEIPARKSDTHRTLDSTSLPRRTEDNP